MTERRHIRISHWLALAVVAFLGGCVEKINFDVPLASNQTVIEGMITADPGPYTVKISRGLELDSDTSMVVGIEGAVVRLFDDSGNVEDLVESSPGIYQTGGAIQGQFGHAYHIEVQTAEGKFFRSVPDTLTPIGEIEEIRHVYEARTIVEDPLLGEVAADVFNIFMDATAGGENSNYVRWKYTGTYEVLTNPELRIEWVQGSGPNKIPWADPLPCSGYVRVWQNARFEISKRTESECSTCWVKDFEPAPQLADDQFVRDGQFQNVKITEIPINAATFHEKYRIQIELMSLSRTAFNFFNLVREQKVNATSLFQPPSSEIRGNIEAENPDDIVLGLFWATAIDRRTLFISRDEVPYPLLPIETVVQACYDFYPNASTVKPEGWED